MVGRGAWSERLQGTLWLLPMLSLVGALVAGGLLSLVNPGAGTILAFQGTADDARTLLIGISGTMITVIALLLGLTVVALQLACSQYSPRLLRNFLRDRPTQYVLSAFVATFTYSVAGLYTVGVSSGGRTADFPRLAVSGSIFLLFLSLGLLVYYANHLTHSMQLEAIMEVVQENTLAVIKTMPAGVPEPGPVPPDAAELLARHSGYVQVVLMDRLLECANRHRIHVRLRPRVGEHVVAGTTLAWVWQTEPGQSEPDLRTCGHSIVDAVRVGPERTFEQDAAFGIRQLVDIVCKAMSPAVNDPYTAVQAVDRLAIVFSAMVVRKLGYQVVTGASGAQVIVPGRRFGDYLATMCGLVRRYGAAEPTVAIALLRLLTTCAAVGDASDELTAVLTEQSRLIVDDAERGVAQSADLVDVHAEAGRLS